MQGIESLDPGDLVYIETATRIPCLASLLLISEPSIHFPGNGKFPPWFLLRSSTLFACLPPSYPSEAQCWKQCFKQQLQLTDALLYPASGI